MLVTFIHHSLHGIIGSLWIINSFKKTEQSLVRAKIQIVPAMLSPAKLPEYFERLLVVGNICCQILYTMLHDQEQSIQKHMQLNFENVNAVCDLKVRSAAVLLL